MVKELRGAVLPDCPFCGKSLAYAIDDDGRPSGLIHGLPTCQTFRDLDPLDFITKMRNKMQADRNIS